jgi:predicted outer membrane repeat protein
MTNNFVRRLALSGASVVLLFGFASAQTAQAATGNTYIVTTNADDAGNVPATPCSGTAPVFTCATLRDAITVANGDLSGPTINFAISASTIVLGGPLPSIFASMTIDGTSQNITVSGAGQYQVVIIYSGTVTINALTIANGNCVECNGGAIAILPTKASAPFVTVSNSTFNGNSAGGGGMGGAIYTLFQLTVVNSTFYNNSASGGGGAITIDGNGEWNLYVTNTTFSSNSSPHGGSAIYAPNFGTATLTNNIFAAELPVGNTNPGNCVAAPNLPSQQFSDGGGNLSDDPNNTCGFFTGEGATSQYNVPDSGTAPPPLGLNLGNLANNGGPTETVALLANSAAISSAVVASCPTADQRGVTRPSSGALAGTCSSGALQFPVTSTTTSSTGTIAGCTAPAVCNLSGGDSQTVVAGTAAAAATLASVGTESITENLCIIAQDPREICGANSHTPFHTRNTTFPVSEFCPGFGNTVVPDYLCGAYSSAGPGVPPHAPNNGLAVLEGIGDDVNAIPGLLWLNDANPDVYFGFSPAGSECNSIGLPISPLTGLPDGISVAWAPWSGSSVEGSIPENPRAMEITDGCGGQKNPTLGISVTLIGVTMNLSNAVQELGPAATRNSPTVNLIEFAEYKYVNLFVDVSEANIPTSNKAKLLAIITQSALFLAGGNHACAETTLYDADSYVINNAGVFLGNAVDPNSYGRTRMRLLNLFYTLYTRLDMHPNPITNLSVSVGFPLLAPGFVPPVCTKPHL